MLRCWEASRCSGIGRFRTAVNRLASRIAHPSFVTWKNYKPRFGEPGYRTPTYARAEPVRLRASLIPLAFVFVAVAVMWWITDPFRSSDSGSDAQTYYRNCAEARAAGAAPMHQGEPGYRAGLDADGDGIACEPYRGW
jgi:hypothetical protein